MIVGCDVELSSGVDTPNHTALHLLAQMQRVLCMAGRVLIEADLRLQPLIRLSLLTLEPVDRPSDEDGYNAGV